MRFHECHFEDCRDVDAASLVLVSIRQYFFHQDWFAVVETRETHKETIHDSIGVLVFCDEAGQVCTPLRGAIVGLEGSKQMTVSDASLSQLDEGLRGIAEGCKDCVNLALRERTSIAEVGLGSVAVFLNIFGRKVQGCAQFRGSNRGLFFDSVTRFVVTEGQECDGGRIISVLRFTNIVWERAILGPGSSACARTSSMILSSASRTFV